MTTVEVAPLTEQYWQILREYLEHDGETLLNRGYELGRRALMDGRGVLEMAAIHHLALRRLAAEQCELDRTLRAAGEFFAECLSAFEMSHRGAREGMRALRGLNEALEAESKRIAHALHDEAGQMLASVHIVLADIVAAGVPAAARARFSEIGRLLKQIEDDLRNLSHELRPTVLDDLGLAAALEFLAERVAKRTGLVVTVDAAVGERLPAAVEIALYRIVQEALNNTVKHAHARAVRIELRRLPAHVTCHVSDDGRGFDAQGAPAAQGLGLLGIRERLNALGGSLQIRAEPRRGTTLIADIPLGGTHA
ncbi:MAG: ATP-binding protein [Sulfurifustis sp.]